MLSQVGGKGTIVNVLFLFVKWPQGTSRNASAITYSRSLNGYVDTRTSTIWVLLAMQGTKRPRDMASVSMSNYFSLILFFVIYLFSTGKLYLLIYTVTLLMHKTRITYHVIIHLLNSSCFFFFSNLVFLVALCSSKAKNIFSCFLAS